MAVVELTTLALKDEVTFNPMAILELLKQICVTCGHVSNCVFKALQEKEQYTNFYILGGWQTIHDHEQFIRSDLSQKLTALIEETFRITSTIHLQADINSVLSIQRPIVAYARFEVTNRLEFSESYDQVKRQLESDTEDNYVGAFAEQEDLFVIFSGWRSVAEHTNKFVSDEQIPAHLLPLKQHSVTSSLVHLELNQFI